MNRNLRLAGLILLSPVIVSCSSAAVKDSPGKPVAERLIAGSFYPNLPALADTSVKYALYLPSCWSPTGNLPVMLCFDPSASGSLPVTRYRDLAEKYGMILAGSNSSRNNQPMEDTERIIWAMFEELGGRLGADPEMIFLSGFSGGSRIASLVAMYRGSVRGVIACGAGLPATDQPPRHPFDYYGIVGAGDFNLWEMRDLDEHWSLPGTKHALTVFRGIHEWPPAGIFNLAVCWHLSNAMDRGLIRGSDEIRNSARAMANDLSRSGILVHLTEQDLQCRKKEMALQQLYREAFTSRELAWWKRQIEKLKDTKDGSPSDTLMNYRLKAYIGLLCYSFSMRALSSKDPEALDYAIQVYGMADPSNGIIPELKTRLAGLRP